MFYIIKGKYIIISLSLIMFIIVSAFTIHKTVSVFENSVSNDIATVILDAGHGYPDGGAVGITGIEEKDINLAIVKKLEEVLEAKGMNVILTRMGDNSLFNSDDNTIREKKRSDMNTRKAIMENSNADLFLSIHMNSFSDKSANGLHVFYAKNHSEIEPLASEIQTRISEITGAATHSVKTADEKLFLMKKPPIPALLIECGFISNPAEEQKLCDNEYQTKIAWAIAEAICEFKNSN